MKSLSRKQIQMLLDTPSYQLYESLPSKRLPSTLRGPIAKKVTAKIAAKKTVAAKMGRMPSPYQKGKKIFKELTPQLFKVICMKWQYCKKKDKSIFIDKLELVCLISDSIIGYCGNFPPITISAIIVKMGLSKFCKCYEKELLKE